MKNLGTIIALLYPALLLNPINRAFGREASLTSGAQSAAKSTFSQFTRIHEGDPVTDSDNSFGAAWVDYDNDDDLDLFVTNWPVYTERNCLYHNNGDGTLTKVTSGPIVAEGGSFGSTWGDMDNDGDLDLSCANSGYFNNDGSRNYFSLNDGHGTFTKVTEGQPVTEVNRSTNAAWGDYDTDGDLDLFVGTDCWSPDCSMPPSLFHNDAGALTRMNNHDIGLTQDFDNSLWADYDGDGDPDLYMWRAWLNTNALFENEGDGSFTEISTRVIAEDNSSSSCWADYDNDGDLDVFVTSDYAFFSIPNALFENNGDGTFTKVTQGVVVSDTGYISSAAVWGDYDRDGDLDLFVANQNNEHNLLYRNNGNSNTWINIRCIGTLSNRSAIGTTVRLLATIEGTSLWQMRQISSQSSYLSQNSMNAHFGLGDATVIDSIKFEWPSGMIDKLTEVRVNQFLTVTEGECADTDGDGITDMEDNCPETYNPAQADFETGDINCEDGINVLNVLAVVNHILGTAPLVGAPLDGADCNDDGSINIVDGMGIVNVILGIGECAPSAVKM